MKPPRIPLATYRLQFNRDFTFADATGLVPYLASLGISHIYASPYLMARPGSTHGYDIIDHNRLNPEIGTEEDFERFVSALHDHGMGQILDIVPNHMGVMGSDNFWWMDVLENGESSNFAEFFDIDWQPLKDELVGKILVPVLGNQYGAVLDCGELKLTFDRPKGEFSVFYKEHKFPLDPTTYPRVLQTVAAGLQRLGSHTEDTEELNSLITAFLHLPLRSDLSGEKRTERLRDKEIHKRRLALLCAKSTIVAEIIDQTLQEINGTPGDPASFNQVHELIKAQAYRLAYWRVAADDINYRRFFDINDLAGLSVENEMVFEATHRFVLRLLREEKINGFRIDHPDGLYDPEQYFRRLHRGLPPEHGDSDAKQTYIVVEKILTGTEELPKHWPVDGTTGYDFMNLLNGLFVDPTQAWKMSRIYRSFVDRPINFDRQLYLSKKIVMHTALGSELSVLANALSRLALADRHTCDFTVKGLRDAISKVVACFPVYRTYISGDNVSQIDRSYIEQAIECAKQQSLGADVSVFDFVRDILLTPGDTGRRWSFQRAAIRFAAKFQQFTSPVMAKGLEDTCFYRYNRLISLNEVGGDPGRFGVSTEVFHCNMLERAEFWPHSMLGTSTHDCKRSEDVRARINVLSEVPSLWRKSLRRWQALNQDKKTTIGKVEAPSLNDEYLLYQTLIGVWPLDVDSALQPAFCERIARYMLKAAREAKERTSWANPENSYEKATTTFVHAILSPGEENKFLETFLPFQQYVSKIGMLNSLSQTLLKLTAPGVPDLYQGNELWDFSLVDPDSRRPVDYRQRQDFLGELSPDLAHADDPLASIRRLVNKADNGRIKLYLTLKALTLRRRWPDLFLEGEYRPLAVRGKKANHVVAFTRLHKDTAAIVVAPRLWTGLLGADFPSQNLSWPPQTDPWEDTCLELPLDWRTQSFHDELTSQTVNAEPCDGSSLILMSALLANFPVALLTLQSAS